MSQFVAPRPQNSRMVIKPRNPLVGPALLRLAGRHRSSASAQRQNAQRTLKQELKTLTSPDRCP
ncbi:hypothetical protein [Roseateles koreensis]|uniref:Uncharacterized protein n=1 Tax=Roseateles koreensis TaxID=2987526 RepID=A0ABT5KNY6_9BURK|nr:hypothetical protein [Roseateles koreensis]MDC8784561.1 hypothetical protein [Roseateles koreensis]